MDREVQRGTNRDIHGQRETYTDRERQPWQSGTKRDRQGHIGTDRDRQRQKETDRDRQGQTGKDRDKQRQTGTAMAMSLLVPACFCLSLFVPALSRLVPAWSMLVPACPCLSLPCPWHWLALVNSQQNLAHPPLKKMLDFWKKKKKKTEKNLCYRRCYPHWSRDSVPSVLGFFQRSLEGLGNFWRSEVTSVTFNSKSSNFGVRQGGLGCFFLFFLPFNASFGLFNSYWPIWTQNKRICF